MPGFSTSNSRSGPRGASSLRSRADWAAISNRLKIKRPNRLSVPSQEAKHRKECPDLYPGEFVSAEFIVLDHRREFSKRPGLNWPTTFAYRLNEPAEPATP